MINDWWNYLAHSESRSKYKGGFVNGKNTSAYNHDYYIHNKEKWSVSNTTRYMGDPNLLPPEEEMQKMSEEELFTAMAAAGYRPESPEELKAAMLELSKDPQFVIAINMIPKEQWQTAYDGSKPYFDNYYSKEETSNSSTSVNFRPNGNPAEGHANNPQAYTYGKKKRPHGRKRGETSASGSVYVRRK